jgi:hypothetical protein
MITPPTRRVHPRKVLRASATVELPGAPPRQVRTWDLGLDGMSIVSPRPISPGRKCTVHLELAVAGVPAAVSLPAKSIHCSLIGQEGFKVGLVFGDLDPVGARAVNEFAQ